MQPTASRRRSRRNWHRVGAQQEVPCAAQALRPVRVRGLLVGHRRRHRVHHPSEARPGGRRRREHAAGVGAARGARSRRPPPRAPPRARRARGVGAPRRVVCAALRVDVSRAVAPARPWRRVVPGAAQRALSGTANATAIASLILPDGATATRETMGTGRTEISSRQAKAKKHNQSPTPPTPAGAVSRRAGKILSALSGEAVEVERRT